MLNKAGLVAFVKMIRERFHAAVTAKLVPGESFKRNPDDAHRRWGATLRTLCLEQKNVEAYLELAEETGLTTEDCHALATLLVTRRTPSMCCRGWSAGSSSRRRHRTAQWRDMTSPN